MSAEFVLRGEVSCRHMGVICVICFIGSVDLLWALRGVQCSDALEPGGSRGWRDLLPLWASLVAYHPLVAEGVSVRWAGSLKGC